MTEKIVVKVKYHIGILTINRPEAMNAMNLSKKCTNNYPNLSKKMRFHHGFKPK